LASVVNSREPAESTATLSNPTMLRTSRNYCTYLPLRVLRNSGFDPEATFAVPPEVYDYYHKTAAKGAEAEKEWNALFKKYSEKFEKEAKELTRLLNKELPEGWQKCLPVYSPYVI
jgi:hypothetical protein